MIIILFDVASRRQSLRISCRLVPCRLSLPPLSISAVVRKPSYLEFPLSYENINSICVFVNSLLLSTTSPSVHRLFASEEVVPHTAPAATEAVYQPTEPKSKEKYDKEPECSPKILNDLPYLASVFGTAGTMAPPHRDRTPQTLTAVELKKLEKDAKQFGRSMTSRGTATPRKIKLTDNEIVPVDI